LMNIKFCLVQRNSRRQE